MPIVIQEAGALTSKRFIEFFTAHIRNKNTRDAYGRAVRDFFTWCDENRIGPLIDIEVVHIARRTLNSSPPRKRLRQSNND